MPPGLRRFPGVAAFSSLSSSNSVPILWRPAAGGNEGGVAAGDDLITVQVLSWGRGSSGQLGGGKEEIRFYPNPVSSLLLPKNFRLGPVSGRLSGAGPPPQEGVKAMMGLSKWGYPGKLWMWGKGDGGRLGLGNEVSVFQPTLNPNLGDIRSVALGGLHSTALLRCGDIFTWGYGGFGALGHSVYSRELLPRRVIGPWHERELFTWGRDEGEGRLGLGPGGGPGEAGSFSTPSKVGALPVPVAAVSCGGFFTMALSSEGKLWSWGANSNYELGRGNNVSDWRPKQISSLQDVNIIQVACGGYHSLALTDRGEVLSWGHGGHGQLGHQSTQNQKVPHLIESLAKEKVVYVACGGSSSAAITDTGKLYMWGNARDCQLGIPGLPDVQPLPLEVKFLWEDEDLGPHRVLQVAVGASHAMCLVLRQQQARESGAS
ncbi:unnamed protein product [Spirodela intermedia]|uniref:RCC1-like domain-containing protein n=1 Tax=Spirodela intermedia TaxID=51605 RepID=A0A7I8JIW4_SPIIN|nr:unnamed protein product [Spirodela intermedia]CAA6669861.1 unnamed protein product [Spirodela intermedia]